MKTIKKKTLSILLVFCMLFSMVNSAFAANYEGDAVVQGLEGIQPEDTLTLPDNTVRATLTAMWGVNVIFEDWDETELKSDTVAVSDTETGNSRAPQDPTRDEVSNITGPGPIIYRATYVEDHGISGDTGTVLIPFAKTWTGGSDAVRPDSITVKLYKYLGNSFNPSNATLVESKTITAADDWKYTFDISNEALYSGTSYSSSTAYKWAVVEDDVAGYTEAAHTDPSVVFNPPEVAGSGWNRITPCSEINITTSGNDKSIVCAKKGNSAIVWSVDPLSQAERTMIQNSARSGISGAGGIQSFSFISGFGTSSAFGLTVTETQIQFSDSSAWSFFATGVYNKSSTQTNASSITNNYAPEAATFAIPVTKVVEGTPTAASSFEFTLTPITDGAPMPANDGATLTITGAGTGNFGDITYTEPGTWVYSVSETAGSAAGYTYDNTAYLVTVTVTDTSGTLGAVANVKTVSGVNVDAAVFTNTYSTGDLIVTKTVDGNAGSSTKEFSFTVTLQDTSISGTYGDMTFVNGVATFTLKGGDSKTATGLPNGVGYTVVEADYAADGYVTAKSGDEGTIVGDDELTAAFTNTRNAEGSLTVSKTLAGNDTDSTKDFTFTIKLDTTLSGTYSGVVFTNGEATITLKGGESKTIEGLPNGTGYTVTEADYSADGYENSNPNGYTGTIDENTPAVAAFTNTRNTYGNLTVTKTVSGNAADSTKAFSFTVTLGDKAINGTYGDMSFTNGVATFTLKGGESKTATGLPAGTSYTVTEADYSADGYVTTKTGDTGTITDGKTATAAFTNTKNADPSPYDYKFSFTKKWSGGKEDSINWTLYKSDGTVAHKKFNKKIISDTEWYYEAWFEGPVDYYIVEDVPAGYSVWYENTGAHADETDRCYNGGTIINYKVPKTGDHSNMPLWFSLMGISVLGMIGTLFIKTNKRRKAAHLRNK